MWLEESRLGVLLLPEIKTCPFCGEQVGTDDDYCKRCDAELKVAPAGASGRALPEGKVLHQGEDEFRELDYRPKINIRFMFPVLVIFMVLGIFTAVYFIMSSDEPTEVADNGSLEVPEKEGEAEPDPAEPGPEEEDEELEPEEDLYETLLPDYDHLEAVLEDWVIERLDEPDVKLLDAEDLDDLDRFYETYDPEEDFIIFYQVESKSEEFVSVLFGLPFSEWSIKAVFHWRDGEWFFLREEPIV